MPDWELLFTPSAPPLESIIRGTVTFLALLLLLRVVGRRESGGLGITDILLVVLVAQAAAAGLSRNDASMTDGLIVVVTMLFWSVAIDALSYRFPRLAPVLKAKPRPLIDDGELNHRLMRREFMTVEEVESQLRLHGIEHIGEVARAYIEPNGMISVFRSDGKQPEVAERPPTMQ
ncbi:DUF421 domain-containing protein [Mycolicibacterium sp.]|uniref:DUF421 domain-containing protein n=1 Tax=Mycolicibacterium sp. TaxID=2320850 RepID=UPI00355D1D29